MNRKDEWESGGYKRAFCSCTAVLAPLTMYDPAFLVTYRVFHIEKPSSLKAVGPYGGSC